MKKIRVLIADDHAVVRAGIRLLLESQTDMEVVGEAQNGRESLTQAQKLKPDVILMDITMPDMGGVEATQAIKEAYPQAQILALTMHEDAAYFFQMLQAAKGSFFHRWPRSSISPIYTERILAGAWQLPKSNTPLK